MKTNLTVALLLGMASQAAAPPNVEELANNPPLFLETAMKAFMAGGEKSLRAVMAAAHTGIIKEEFEKVVKDWLRTAKHRDRTGREGRGEEEAFYVG